MFTILLLRRKIRRGHCILEIALGYRFATSGPSNYVTLRVSLVGVISPHGRLKSLIIKEKPSGIICLHQVASNR
jgi:hypothetical protein